jgi:hypothetical protein
MANSNAAPLTRVLETTCIATAAGSDASFVVGVAGEDETVSAVSYIPVSTITGANTNTRTIALVNKGAAGAGTTSVASLALTSGNNITGFDEGALTLSATAADLVVTSGDVLAFTSTHAASGLADPGGKVRVTLVRR